MRHSNPLLGALAKLPPRPPWPVQNTIAAEPDWAYYQGWDGYGGVPAHEWAHRPGGTNASAPSVRPGGTGTNAYMPPVHPVVAALMQHLGSPPTPPAGSPMPTIGGVPTIVAPRYPAPGLSTAGNDQIANSTRPGSLGSQTTTLVPAWRAVGPQMVRAGRYEV